MENLLEPLAVSRVSKDAAGKFIATQLAVWRRELWTEGCQHVGERRLARLDDVARQVVGIHYRHPARAEKLRRGRLPHPNTAS